MQASAAVFRDSKHFLSAFSYFFMDRKQGEHIFKSVVE